MDRLVRVDLKVLELNFIPDQRCTATFRLTNLMHTMSVAVSLSTTNPSVFSVNHPLSILPPLASAPFSLHPSPPYDLPPLSSPLDSLLVRTVMLPTGKAQQEDLRRLFNRPGPHVFKDATIPISFVGAHVVEFLLSPPVPVKTLETVFLLSKAISACTASQLTSLLRFAVDCGNPTFVSALIDAGGDVNDRDSDGRSMMSLAVCSGNLDIVKVLIKSGCETDDLTDRFLHDAATMNRVDLMEVLCCSSGGISGNWVNSVDSVGRTPVHVSALCGHIDALQFCVSIGGDPDLADLNGWTPLHCAAAEGHLESVKFLLNCSYSKQAIDKDGKTPFSLAMDNGHLHLLDSLRLRDGLHRAARLDDVHGMKSCLAQGAKVNGRDQNGWTPLHRAAFKGQIESVKLLLSHGAQIDLVDDAGYTPLHCAIEMSHTQVAMYLIAHGARANLKSLKGVIPLNLDCFKNHPASVFPLCGKKERA